MSTVYLITGANRGIGKGFVEAYLQRPDTTVICAVRDPSSSSSQSLLSLPTGTNSRAMLVKIDSSIAPDAGAAASSLSAQGITHVDVLIANAAICTDNSRVDAIQLDVLQRHIEVNVYGTLALFQAFLPLLNKSKQPKFAALGSPLGSLTAMNQRPFPSAAYGPSKALLHWFVRKISFENQDITSFVLDPGFVKTDMGNTGAKLAGLQEAFTDTEDSVAGMVRIIDRATRDREGLVMSTFDDTVFPF